jgi:predicted Zn-dependent peptidase
VGGFDHEQSSAFRTKHYLTGNCTIAAAGSVEHEELVRLAERYLSGLPSGPRSVRPVAEAAGEARLAVLEKETEQAHICYGVSTMNAHHPDRFALALLDGVFGGGMSSRLFQEIREKRGLAYAVYSFSSRYQDTGEFAVYAGTRPGNAEEVVQLVRIEMERIAEGGVTPDELDRVRQAAKGHLVLGMESTRMRMTRLGRNDVTGGEILSADELMERFDSVTMDDIKRVSADVLSRQKVLAVIGPFTKERLEPLVQ